VSPVYKTWPAAMRPQGWDGAHLPMQRCLHTAAWGNLSREGTHKGGGAAGVATIGTAGVEVVQQAVAETQSALQPLIPYLDTLRWLFIVVALIGVSVTIYARWDDWRKGRR